MAAVAARAPNYLTSFIERYIPVMIQARHYIAQAPTQYRKHRF